MNTNEDIYAGLVAAAENKATGSKVATLIAQAFAAGWETGDVAEALGEGGYNLSFELIDTLGMRAALRPVG